MKNCPTPQCSQQVPESFLATMSCSMCLTFGTPEVRMAPPMRIVRTKEMGRETAPLAAKAAA
jgi:hypothetical protein